MIFLTESVILQRCRKIEIRRGLLAAERVEVAAKILRFLRSLSILALRSLRY